MNIINFIILASATWYVAETITNKTGPWGVFAKLRERLPLGGLTSCIHCMAIWVAAVMWLLCLYARPVVIVFAVAGGALMLRSYTGVRHE